MLTDALFSNLEAGFYEEVRKTLTQSGLRMHGKGHGHTL
jgi:hypothetical protein